MLLRTYVTVTVSLSLLSVHFQAVFAVSSLSVCLSCQFTVILSFAVSLPSPSFLPVHRLSVFAVSPPTVCLCCQFTVSLSLLSVRCYPVFAVSPLLVCLCCAAGGSAVSLSLLSVCLCSAVSPLLVCVCCQSVVSLSVLSVRCQTLVVLSSAAGDSTDAAGASAAGGQVDVLAVKSLGRQVQQLERDNAELTRRIQGYHSSLVFERPHGVYDRDYISFRVRYLKDPSVLVIYGLAFIGECKSTKSKKVTCWLAR